MMPGVTDRSSALLLRTARGFGFRTGEDAMALACAILRVPSRCCLRFGGLCSGGDATARICS
eukprot:156811-Amphidinium_carterae.2